MQCAKIGWQICLNFRDKLFFDLSLGWLKIVVFKKDQSDSETRGENFIYHMVLVSHAQLIMFDRNWKFLKYKVATKEIKK